ncbi:MAG: periplasmic heavy metal sensor [Pseudomonadota bacterium]|nr:periplasmic heavy metal sensor [Pseudomonadota bacterium]
MLKIVLITLVVVGVIAGFGIAWAKHKGYCSAEGRMQHVTERISKKLDLDDEQKSRLTALGERFQALRGDWREHRTELRADVQDLLKNDRFDRERALQMIDERQQTMIEGKRDMVNAFAAFSDSLEPEQRTRLAELIGEWSGHHRGHPGWAH